MLGEVRGTYINPWKTISNELLFLLLWFSILWGMERKHTLYFTFSRLYHLLSMKNHSMADAWGPSGSSPSFSFGFYCSLSNRETTDVLALLSLIRKFII